MKKVKSKSLTKSARKAAFKDIKLRLIKALNEATEQLGKRSKKLNRTIKKGAKKFAKKISKQIRNSQLIMPDGIPATIIRPNTRTNISSTAKPVSTRTRSVQKGTDTRNGRSAVASTATAAKKVKPLL